MSVNANDNAFFENSSWLGLCDDRTVIACGERPDSLTDLQCDFLVEDINLDVFFREDVLPVNNVSIGGQGELRESGAFNFPRDNALRILDEELDAFEINIDANIDLGYLSLFSVVVSMISHSSPVVLITGLFNSFINHFIFTDPPEA